MGTYRGLNRFDPETGQFQRFYRSVDPESGLRDDRILSLMEDHRQQLWIGTNSGGLHRMDPETGKINPERLHVGSLFALSQSRILSLYEDRNKNIWAGTYGGLIRLDPESGEHQHYTTADGLPNNVIYGILADENHHLWLSTNQGLSRLNPESGRFINYSVDDGLQSREFNGGAYYKSRDGTLFFGGINGFNYFRPDSLVMNELPPNVEITGFQIAGTPQPDRYWQTSDKVDLDYNENFFSFSFAALDFTSPGMNRFRYKLEGLDPDWVEAGNRTEAYYTSVPPGRYRFLVQGSNSDGVWSTAEAVIPIIIAPPFWRTWWFYLLIVGLAVAIMTFLYQNRINSLISVERTRRKIADDLHDDIGSKVSGIALILELSSKKENPDRNLLKMASVNAREVVSDLRDAIWFVESGNDTMHSLTGRMQREAVQLLPTQEIEFSADNVPEKPLSMEQRRHIYLVYKELLHNISKHAGADKVWIELDFEEGRMRIRVKDNGAGFDPSSVSKGRGMHTLQSRIKKLKGSLNIKSKIGEGTDVVARFKV